MPLLHTAFNYHDPLVQLRLGALLAVLVIIACLGVLELRQPLSARTKLLLGVGFTLGCLIVGYTLITLRGA